MWYSSLYNVLFYLGPEEYMEMPAQKVPAVYESELL